MVFQYASLVFSTPRSKSGPQDLDLGSGWPGDLSEAKKGGLENMNLLRKWDLMGFGGNLCEGNGLYGTQEAFGQARFPPNPLKK